MSTPTTVTDLTIEEILADLPVDTSGITVTSTPVSLTQVAAWKAQAEARAALLLRGQGIDVSSLSADAKLFAAGYVKAKVAMSALTVMKQIDIVNSVYVEEVEKLEGILKTFEEQLDQRGAVVPLVNSNIDTNKPNKGTRWGTEFTGF